MKLKRKNALNLSLFIMAFGFLFSLVGLFGNKVTADQVTTSGSSSLTWVVMGIGGLIFVVIGLMGIIFGISAYRE
jgi:hypothetical protein